MEDPRYSGLRILCFIIGYMHRCACLIDIIVQLLLLIWATEFFKCDIMESMISYINGCVWMERILIILNVGTHGLYPFPLNLDHHKDNTVIRRTCYPHMLHLHYRDLFNLLINLQWLGFVTSFLDGLRKDNVKSITTFFAMLIIKFIAQYTFLISKHNLSEYLHTMNIAQVIQYDTGINVILLAIIWRYIKVLQSKKLREDVANAEGNQAENVEQVNKESLQSEVTFQATDVKISIEEIKKESLLPILVGK